MAAAEARKAEGANATTLLVTSPPFATGNVACNQARSEREQLVIDDRDDLSVASNSSSARLPQQGDVRKMYINFGALGAFLRIKRPSWAFSLERRDDALF